MEQVGINNVQQVQYQPKTAATEPSFQGKKPEMKEDGDKKLLGALAGLGAIGLGGVLIARDLKKGSASNIKKVWNKITKKSAGKAANATGKAVRKASEETSAIATKLKSKTAEQIKDIISSTQTKIQTAAKELSAAQKTLKETTAKIAKKEAEIQTAIKKGHTQQAQDLKRALEKLNATKLENESAVGKLQKQKDTLIQLMTDAKTYGKNGQEVLNQQRIQKHLERAKK